MSSERSLILRPSAEKDYAYFVRHKPKLAAKIARLFDEIVEHPYSGTGKPEPLKHQLGGCWSRRIDKEHRIVYEVKGDVVIIRSCRFHYDA